MKIPRGLLTRLVLFLLWLVPSALPAQELPEGFVFPSQNDLVQALANESSRSQALLSLLSLQRLLERYGLPGATLQLPALVAEFSNDRSRLNRLAELNRYFRALPAQQDLASQLLRLEVTQHELPLWSDPEAARQRIVALATDLVFTSERIELAAGVLPIALARAERSALSFWEALNRQLETDANLMTLLAALPPETWAVFATAEPSIPKGGNVHELLRQLAMETVSESPPDPMLLSRVRRLILLDNSVTSLEQQMLQGLATAIDGLHDRRYLQFIQFLLGTTTDLVNRAPVASLEDINAAAPAPGKSAVAALALEILPGISAWYARDFADVDPQINSTIAAVFNVLSSLQAEAALDRRVVRRQLTDAMAQMLLLVPDAAYYFDQPVRTGIREEIDICTSIVASQYNGDATTVSREQFDGCIRSFNRLVARDVRDTPLSGNPSGPFESDQLRRELSLPAWQRINYTLGYLRQVIAGGGCPVEGPNLVNPVEWTLLASTFRWFADQRPVFFQTPESERQLDLMIAAGEHLVDQLRAEASCISLEAGADSVNRVISLYRQELNELMRGIGVVQAQFRAVNFKAGADVDVNGDALQATNYSPEEIMIGPCDTATSCEMNNELPATRALVGLFPNPYLVADQSRMGEIQICYDNVRWEHRRSEQARKNDPGVANYFGYFTFDLVGRFQHGQAQDEVFAFRLQSPDEYNYLFAANDEEILELPCPMELVGTSIITELMGTSLPIVPNRLTYLTAARTLPSRLFAENWASGGEWRDWFITGRGVTRQLENDGQALIDPVNTHLQQLQQQSESSVYNALMSQPLRFAGQNQMSLAQQVSDINSAKSLIRAVITLFASDVLQYNDGVRAALEGNSGLLGNRTIRRLRDATTPVAQISAIAQSRLQDLQRAWSAEPESMRRSGIVSKPFLMAYLQLLELRKRYFSVAPVTPAETGPAPQPSPESSTESPAPPEATQQDAAVDSPSFP